MATIDVISAAPVGEIEILHPGGKRRINRVTYELAARPSKLKGLRFGFLDNGKSNADVALERIEEMVLAQYAPSAAVRAPRKQAGKAPVRREVGKADEFLFDLARKVDAVVNGVGD